MANLGNIFLQSLNATFQQANYSQNIAMFQNSKLLMANNPEYGITNTKVYKNPDWNVSVTTQPHSEVAALAIFQHLLMEGKEFDLEFENPVLEVIPTAHGKNVNIHDENR